MAGLLNLVRVATATTGTSDLSLGSAVSGYLDMAGAGAVDGERYFYALFDIGTPNSEVGSGQYHSAGPTFDREIILNSTNGGSKISLSGNAEMVITAPVQAIKPYASVYGNDTAIASAAGPTGLDISTVFFDPAGIVSLATDIATLDQPPASSGKYDYQIILGLKAVPDGVAEFGDGNIQVTVSVGGTPLPAAQFPTAAINNLDNMYMTVIYSIEVFSTANSGDITVEVKNNSGVNGLFTVYELDFMRVS